VTDVRGPVGGDDHVVAVRREVADAAVELELAVLEPVDALVAHRDHEHATVGEPAQPRRLPGHRADALASAVAAHREHATLEEVGVPQAAVVPARPLAEVEPVDECLECGHAAFSRSRAPAATGLRTVTTRGVFAEGAR